MKIFIGKRQTGKSFNLIKLALEKNYAIVTTNLSQKICLEKYSREQFDKVPLIVSFGQYKNNWLRGYKYAGVVIDDVDLILREIFRGACSPIEAVAFNVDDRFDDVEILTTKE